MLGTSAAGSSFNEILALVRGSWLIALAPEVCRGEGFRTLRSGATTAALCQLRIGIARDHRRAHIAVCYAISPSKSRPGLALLACGLPISKLRFGDPRVRPRER